MRNGRLLHLINAALLFWCCCLGAAAVFAAELEVKDAWVRLAPPTVAVNAAYMSLGNNTDRTITITRVDADCCAMTMLHETRQDANSVSMVHRDKLDIAPQSAVQLKPGGLHIMLMRPAQSLSEGDQVKLTITMSDGSTHLVVAPVRASYE